VELDLQAYSSIYITLLPTTLPIRLTVPRDHNLGSRDHIYQSSDKISSQKT
jgi:hypothetical protein